MSFLKGRDKKHVFINSAILKEADPLTFFQIQDYYWKDQNNVFLLQFGSQRQIVKNADPKSFQLLDQNLWAKDNNHVFYKFDTLPKTNPNTFKIIDKEWGKLKKGYNKFLKVSNFIKNYKQLKKLKF